MKLSFNFVLLFILLILLIFSLVIGRSIKLKNNYLQKQYYECLSDKSGIQSNIEHFKYIIRIKDELYLKRID